MAIVIDVDAHFEPGPEWLAARPDLAARLPAIDYGATAVRGMCGDLLDSMPAEQRPPITDMYSPGLLDPFVQDKQDESERRAEFEGKNMVEVANAKARLKRLDAQGIDIQNIICRAGVSYRMLEDAGLAARRSMPQMTGWPTHLRRERRTAVASDGARYGDLDQAIAELS